MRSQSQKSLSLCAGTTLCSLGLAQRTFFCICEHFYNDHSCLIFFLFVRLSLGDFCLK